MAPETTLRESHDACLLLQRDLESMDEVERAFVHADYTRRARARARRGRVESDGSANPSSRAESSRGVAFFFVRFVGGWFSRHSRRRGRSPPRRRAASRESSSSIDARAGRAVRAIPDARRERHVCPSQEGHRRLGSNVALTCEEGEGPAFDTIGAPLLPER